MISAWWLLLIVPSTFVVGVVITMLFTLEYFWWNLFK